MKKAKLLALRINRDRCIFALVSSVLVLLFVFLAIVTTLLQAEDEVVKEVGLKTFRMFTVQSNMLMAFGAAMVIPYAVDGLRYRNYHLPRWIVSLLFMGVTGVTLTFLIAVTLLSSMAGFFRMMLARANLYLHTLVPLISMFTFVFLNSDHRIRVKDCFLAMAPMVLYSAVYLFMAFAVGEEAGGWRDHYHFADLTVPIYIVAPLMYALTFGIAFVLRLLHNAVHRRNKASLERYYQEYEDFDQETLEEAILALARENRARDKGGEIVVPRRILLMMEKKYRSGRPLSELCALYINEYLSQNANVDGAEEQKGGVC